MLADLVVFSEGCCLGYGSHSVENFAVNVVCMFYIQVIFTDAFRAKRYLDPVPPDGFKFEHSNNNNGICSGISRSGFSSAVSRSN